MEHRNISELKDIAEVQAGLPHTGLTRAERLERWAKVIEQQTHRRLRPLSRVEYAPAGERAGMSTYNSPLSLAYEDPVLREDGLKSDKLGDGLEYFGLSERDAHTIVCDCLYVGAMPHAEVARRIRTVAKPRMTEHAAGLRFGLATLSVAAVAALAIAVI